jgi:hypothetical protein
MIINVHPTSTSTSANVTFVADQPLRKQQAGKSMHICQLSAQQLRFRWRGTSQSPIHRVHHNDSRHPAEGYWRNSLSFRKGK